MPASNKFKLDFCLNTQWFVNTTIICCLSNRILLSLAVVSVVWQEQTVLRLMQIIELPFLENLLEAKDKSLQRSYSVDDDLEAPHSSCFDWLILKSLRDCQYVFLYFLLI